MPVYEVLQVGVFTHPLTYRRPLFEPAHRRGLERAHSYRGPALKIARARQRGLLPDAHGDARRLSVVTRDRTVVRRLAVGEIEHHFVDEAPAPALRRIIALDDRMARGVKMFGRVLVRGIVAASHMPARSAESEMNPDIAALEAFLAAERAWADVANGVQMRACFRHCCSLDPSEMGNARVPEELVNRPPPPGRLRRSRRRPA